MKSARYLGEEEGFIPPIAVAEAAKQGLMLKEKFNRGGTAVGWARAEQPKERRTVSNTISHS